MQVEAISLTSAIAASDWLRLFAALRRLILMMTAWSDLYFSSTLQPLHSILSVCPFPLVFKYKIMASQGGGMPGTGQQPTPAQLQAMQRQWAIEAEKHGMTVPQFIEFLKKKQQEAKAAQQQGGQQAQQQPQPIQPGPPKPEALAVAAFLKSQDLKPRTCILNGQRKDMFKGMLSVFSDHKIAIFSTRP